MLITLAALAGLVLAACGGGTKLTNHGSRPSSQATGSGAVVGLGEPSSGGGPNGTSGSGGGIAFPLLATKNTTRVNGGDPVADAAGVALAVYPSSTSGTHPLAVTIAPTDDWQAALAASVLMSAPTRAPLLLSGPSSLPVATSRALSALAPTGSGAAGGAQVIQVGDVATATGRRTVTIHGSDPYSLAAAIDRFQSAAVGRPSINVVIASATDPAYAMPAAGWAAESGEPILYVNKSGVPAVTRQALVAHQKPHIYVLGPSSVIPDSVLHQLGQYGQVKRISGGDPAANSVAFAEYRDPPCAYGQPCVHMPGSFGWAIVNPGHGYTLVNASRPLDAAAAAPLSASGSFGPELLVSDPRKLPGPVLNYFLNYATPAYNQEGPTAAVYNHGWVIGNQRAVSLPVQAEMDNLLEVVPQK
jgi:ell wall binding domain 2 (CWB2)